MRQRPLILFSAIVLLAAASGPSSQDRSSTEQNPDATPSSSFSDKFIWYAGWWADAGVKARWEHLPGFQMTDQKLHLLWDRALESVLVQDDWLARPPGEVVLLSEGLGRYSPNVGKLSFKLMGYGEIRDQEQLQGQLTYLRFSEPHPNGFNSVTLHVSQGVRISKDRQSLRELGCWRSVQLTCQRTWGDWECESEPAGGPNCVDLAYDDRRWAELPGLEMTREKKHALWNRVLHHALVHDDWLGRPSGTIALSTELYKDSLDTDYEPLVAGATVELRDPGTILELADQHGQFEYLRFTNYRWYRGPVTVRLSVSRTFVLCEPRRTRQERSCERRQDFECQETEDDWTCRVTWQSGDKCDPSRRFTTPCD